MFIDLVMVYSHLIFFELFTYHYWQVLHGIISLIIGYRSTINEDTQILGNTSKDLTDVHMPTSNILRASM